MIQNNLPEPGTMMDTQVLERHVVAQMQKMSGHDVSLISHVRRLGFRRSELREWAEDYFGFKFSKKKKANFKTVEDFLSILAGYEDQMRFFNPQRL